MFSGDIGYIIRFGVGEDISTSENKLKFKGSLSNQEAFEISEQEGLVVGTVDYYVGGQLIYNANEYVEYTVSSEVFKPGYWLASLMSTFNSETKNSAWEVFPIRS